MFSLPVSSGWKPVPTSSSVATRPRVRETPAVGSVMRLRIFRSVDLPGAVTPDHAKRLPLRDTQIDVPQGPDLLTGSPTTAEAHKDRDRRSDRVSEGASGPTLSQPVSLADPFDLNGVHVSDDVCEPSFGALEVRDARHEKEERRGHRHEDYGARPWSADKRPT